MAVVITVYPAASNPTTDVGVSGGNIDTGGGALSEITENVVIPQLQVPADASPDGGPYYYAICIKNVGADPFITPKFWLRNGIIPPAASGVFTLTPESASEADLVRIHFRNTDGDWGTDDITMNGLSPVTGVVAAEASSPVVMEKITSGESSTVSVSNIWNSRGSSLGYLPSGRAIAGSFIQIGLDLAVNNTLTAATRLTAPAGITFSQAFSYATGLYIPGPVNLAAGEFIKVWFKVTVPNGMPMPISGYFQPVVAWRGGA